MMTAEVTKTLQLQTVQAAHQAERRELSQHQHRVSCFEVTEWTAC